MGTGSRRPARPAMNSQTALILGCDPGEDSLLRPQDEGIIPTRKAERPFSGECLSRPSNWPPKASGTEPPLLLPRRSSRTLARVSLTHGTPLLFHGAGGGRPQSGCDAEVQISERACRIQSWRCISMDPGTTSQARQHSPGSDSSERSTLRLPTPTKTMRIC